MDQRASESTATTARVAGRVAPRPGWPSCRGGRSSTRSGRSRSCRPTTIEAIHRASLRILSEIGMEVLGDRALDALSGAGATVDRPTRERPPRSRRRWRPWSRSRRRSSRLHARNPERNLVFGGANLVFGAVGGPAFVSDLDRGRRAGNFADFVDYVRIIGALDIIHQEGGGPLEPTDLPVETRHLDMYRTFAVELDKTWQCLGFRGATRGRRARGCVP